MRRVLDGVQLIAEPEGHLHARIWRGVIADVAHMYVVTRLTLAPFEMADDRVAHLFLMKLQHLFASIAPTSSQQPPRAQQALDLGRRARDEQDGPLATQCQPPTARPPYCTTKLSAFGLSRSTRRG